MEQGPSTPWMPQSPCQVGEVSQYGRSWLPGTCCPLAGVSVPGPFLSLLPGVVLALKRCWKPAGVTVSQEAEAAAHPLLGGQLHGLAPHNPATNWGRVPSLPASVCHSLCVPSTARGGYAMTSASLWDYQDETPAVSTAGCGQ